MLIIMEDRDITAFFQAPLYLKTSRRRDILKVHAAKASRQKPDCFHDIIHILASDTKRDRIHIPKFLEQDTFPFHNGHTRFRSYIPQPQDRRAVRNYRHRVPPPGKLIALADILLNLKTRLGNSRRIGKA